MPDKKYKKLLAKATLFLFFLSFFQGFFIVKPTVLRAGELSSVSDSLSNNRGSFRGELDGAMAAGEGLVTLDDGNPTPLTAPSTSTGAATIIPGDMIKIGTNAPVAARTIIDADQFTLASGIAGSAADGQPVISTVSAVHTITFTPYSSITNGAFRVLIPAYTSGSNYGANDGLPDPGGFDFSGSAPTVACSGGGISSWSPTTASASAITSGTTVYHSFECRYYGSTAPSGAVSMMIGTPGGAKLINPVPVRNATAGNFPGEAATFTFRVQHSGLATGYVAVDETLGRIGVIEAVQVSATISPILTFHIAGIASGQTACNQTTDVTTTYNTVPFADTVSSTAFVEAAQRLTVTTNALSGYSVTASESAVLTNVANASYTIPDTTCGSTCTTVTAADWTNTSQKGFGYSLEDIAGDSVAAALEYNNGATFKARPFGTIGNQIMSSNIAADADAANVCYRLIVAGNQQAGDYANQVIYIATATF